MTAERERLLQKIRQVQALAEKGAGGEKHAAALALERLMKKHGITEADIAEDRREMAWFRFKTPLEERLLKQVIYSVVGNRPFYDRTGRDTNRKHKVVGVECTPAERLEIEASFEFFNAAMQEELKRFMVAFVNKNRIFPPEKLIEAEQNGGGDQFDEDMLKTAFMMASMDEHPRRKAIESGAAK